MRAPNACLDRRDRYAQIRGDLGPCLLAINDADEDGIALPDDMAQICAPLGVDSRRLCRLLIGQAGLLIGETHGHLCGAAEREEVLRDTAGDRSEPWAQATTRIEPAESRADLDERVVGDILDVAVSYPAASHDA